MSRLVRVASVQPPAPSADVDHDQLIATGLSLLGAAGEHGADIACLPEYFDVIGRDDAAWRQPDPLADSTVVCAVREQAARHTMYVVLPVLELRGKHRYNASLVIDRRGEIVGQYDKTHLTRNERDEQGVSPGDAYPVFDLDFGRAGIMVCYDGHFPEVSRLLALNGAEIIFFPSLQRHQTAAQLDVQVRARAVDNYVYVVRSSYGHADDVAWVPGMAPGKSCIVDFEGTVLADAGMRVGLCEHALDLDRPRTRERSYGGEVGDGARFMREDRRPDTYGKLCEP